MYVCIVLIDTNYRVFKIIPLSSTVPCEQLTNTSGEMILCMLGDDGRPSYEDICMVTCNTGYELTGNSTRICQSNGSWSDTSDVCEKGRNIYNE